MKINSILQYVFKKIKIGLELTELYVHNVHDEKQKNFISVSPTKMQEGLKRDSNSLTGTKERTTTIPKPK